MTDTTSLVTTLRHVAGMLHHMPEAMSDIVSAAGAWDTATRQKDAERASNAVDAAAAALQSIDATQWNSSAMGALVDLGCDADGMTFLTLVQSKAPGEQGAVLGRLIQQAQWITDADLPFDQIPSMKQLMGELKLGEPAAARGPQF